MKSKLYIPKKLKVGFQKRDDCYLKTLAYVIYWDDKGVLRKEKSWEDWRDKKIDPIEVDNQPRGGFTLNKDVHRDGGHFGVGRNHIRVYDDRGIEFEITPENLVFILMNTNCVKRSLEGEYVYAWHGQDLVLLPTNCLDYKASAEFTKLQGEKVGAKNFTPGHWYLTKDQKELMYLGRHDWYEWKMEKVGDEPVLPTSYDYLYSGKRARDINHYFRKAKKKHIFISKDKKIEPHSDGGKISRQLTDTVDDDYVGNLELFLGSFNSGAVERIELEEWDVEEPKITIEDITEPDGEVAYSYIEGKRNWNFHNVKNSGGKYLITPYCLHVETNKDKSPDKIDIKDVFYIKGADDSKTLKLENGILVCEDYMYYTSEVIGEKNRTRIDSWYDRSDGKKISVESLKKQKITRMKVYLSNGRSILI